MNFDDEGSKNSLPNVIKKGLPAHNSEDDIIEEDFPMDEEASKSDSDDAIQENINKDSQSKSHSIKESIKESLNKFKDQAS